MRPNRSIASRVERDEDVTVHEDENAHLWAVSYSDFLMALLAFFILFFSLDPHSKSKLILNIAGEFSSNGSGTTFAKSEGKGKGAGGGSPDGNGAIGNSDKEPDTRLPASVFQSLSKLNITVDKDHESLVVNFPDDIFAAGQHTLREDRRQVVDSFFEMLKPYEGQIKIYFEGHADDKPLKIHRNKIIVDNFVLSSLRANSALSLARDFGFSDKNMFIQAASSNVRNTRSLSVRIESSEGGAL